MCLYLSFARKKRRCTLSHLVGTGVLDCPSVTGVLDCPQIELTKYESSETVQNSISSRFVIYKQKEQTHKTKNLERLPFSLSEAFATAKVKPGSSHSR